MDADLCCSGYGIGMEGCWLLVCRRVFVGWHRLARAFKRRESCDEGMGNGDRKRAIFLSIEGTLATCWMFILLF